MKKMYFHIGLHKTATTFLQEQFFPGLSNTTFINRKTIHAAEGWNKLMLADDSLYDENQVIKATDSWEGDRLLLSSESLSGKPLFFHVINRSMIASRLHTLFPDGEIILFIRGQKDLLLSHYNQYVKGRDDGYRTIDEFIWFPGKKEIDAEFFGKKNKLPTGYFNTTNFQVHLDTFKHFELIDLYKSLFSKVHVFLFEDLARNPEETLTRLENVLEDKCVNKAVLPDSRINQSLGYGDLYRKRRLNRMNLATNSKLIRKAYEKLLSVIPVNRGGIEEQYIEHVAGNYYLENNQKIIEKYPEIGVQQYPEKYLVSQSLNPADL